MNWKNISKIVGKAAPIVGTALGGPAGATIGAMVANALGVENTPDAVAEAVRNNPDALLKLKEFELKNEQHIREYTFKVLDVELKDVQNARDIHRLSAMPALITTTMTLFAAAYYASLIYVEFPQENREMIVGFGNQLITLWIGSVAYWIGTTRSSAEKNRIIGK